MKDVFKATVTAMPPGTAFPLIAKNIGYQWREMSEAAKQKYRAAYEQGKRNDTLPFMVRESMLP